jgi:hypothetical protein
VDGVVGDLIFFLNKIDFKTSNLLTINKMSSRKRKYSELNDSEKEPSEILKHKLKNKVRRKLNVKYKRNKKSDTLEDRFKNLTIKIDNSNAYD